MKEPDYKKIDKELKKKYNKILELALSSLTNLTSESDISNIKRLFKKDITNLVKDMRFDIEKGIYTDNGIRLLTPLDKAATKTTRDLKLKLKYIKSFEEIEKTMRLSFGNSWRVYNRYLDRLIGDVKKGKLTYQQVSTEFKRQCKNNGIARVTTKSGRTYRTDYYAEMVTRTEFNKIHSNNQQLMAKENGWRDVRQISKHSHRVAREGCRPFEGKLIAFDNSSKPIEDLDGNLIPVIPVSQTTYGEPAGILGINCTHTERLFVEGFSTL